MFLFRWTKKYESEQEALGASQQLVSCDSFIFMNITYRYNIILGYFGILEAIQVVLSRSVESNFPLFCSHIIFHFALHQFTVLNALYTWYIHMYTVCVCVCVCVCVFYLCCMLAQRATVYGNVHVLMSAHSRVMCSVVSVCCNTETETQLWWGAAEEKN